CCRSYVDSDALEALACDLQAKGGDGGPGNNGRGRSSSLDRGNAGLPVHRDADERDLEELDGLELADARLLVEVLFVGDIADRHAVDGAVAQQLVGVVAARGAADLELAVQAAVVLGPRETLADPLPP